MFLQEEKVRDLYSQSLFIALLLSFSLPPSCLSLLLHLLSFFPMRMTNSKEIPNSGPPKPAPPPPSFSWQDGSCLTLNHDGFARQLGLREIQKVNRGNLIWRSRQNTVKTPSRWTWEPGHNNTSPDNFTTEVKISQTGSKLQPNLFSISNIKLSRKRIVMESGRKVYKL